MEQKAPTNNNNQKVKIITKEFVGKVIEVHTGDSLTIQSIKFGTTGRFCLTNIKAPQIYRNSNKPYAFEAKEFVRKLLIGKEVKVKMEYEKSFTVTRDQYDEEKEDVIEVKEEKTLIFAMIEFEEKQLALEVVSRGLAAVQRPYTEEEQGKLYEELLEAQTEALKKKLGIHKNSEYKPRIFRDLTEKKNQTQARNVFEHLQGSGKMTGVVELVLNGSRFKIRCNEQNCYLMMVLQGVRCLPNDENFPGYDKWSNKALQYSKNQILQRDISFIIEKVDKKGVFQGKLFLNKKEDYALTLLSQGLAVCFGVNNDEKYEKMELEAKAKKSGLWNDNINLQGVKGDFGFKQVEKLNEKKNVQVSEVIDPNEFYLQAPGGSQQLDKLYDELSNYDPTGRARLNAPVKANTPCLALFSQDDTYYRATVVREIPSKKDKYLVHFMDYGNYGEVHIDDMRKQPEGYLKIPPQAQKCALAYVEGPGKKHELYGDSIDCFMDQVWEKKLQAHFVYKYGNTNFVILYPASQVEINSSINEAMLKEGLCQIDESVDLPKTLEIWRATQEKIKQKNLGIWQSIDE